MKNLQERNRGYYRALRQNRRVLNRQLRRMDIAIDDNKTAQEAATSLYNAYNRRVKAFDGAGFWKRFKYLFSGDWEKML